MENNKNCPGIMEHINNQPVNRIKLISPSELTYTMFKAFFSEIETKINADGTVKKFWIDYEEWKVLRKLYGYGK